MLVLDGAYLAGTAPPVFRRIERPSAAELQSLVEQLAERIRPLGAAVHRERSGFDEFLSRLHLPR